MAGLTTHVAVALIGCLIFSLAFKNWKWGIAFFIGQLAPDSIRFGISGLLNNTLNFGKIIQTDMFWKLAFTHYYYTWTLAFAVIFGIIFLLYKKKKMNKKQFKQWFIADAMLLLGVIVHLIIDALIIEKSFWV
jgi:predicted membrane protein